MCGQMVILSERVCGVWYEAVRPEVVDDGRECDAPLSKLEAIAHERGKFIAPEARAHHARDAHARREGIANLARERCPGRDHESQEPEFGIGRNGRLTHLLNDDDEHEHRLRGDGRDG